MATDTLRTKYRPRVLVCDDPESCTMEHNPETGWGEYHHYGCECSECMDYYRSLK